MIQTIYKGLQSLSSADIVKKFKVKVSPSDIQEKLLGVSQLIKRFSFS